MEGINFKRDLIENFIEVSKNFESFPQEALADIDNLVENIKKVDPEKGEIIHKFIECLDGIGKETELHIAFIKNVKALEKHTGSMTKIVTLWTGSWTN